MVRLHWNNSFVNPMQLPLLCEKSEATLVPVVIAGRQADSQSDKILKILYRSQHH